MNLADEFPQLRSYTSPEWIVAAGEDSEGPDLISSARRALADAMSEIDQSFALPTLIDLRLIGESVSDGSLSGDLTFVVNRFQREIEAALPAALAEQGIGKIELVSITEGSAVLHMKPVFATSVEQDGLEIDAESLFDGAVRKVLDVHDALEEGAVAAELPGNEKKLLDAVRLMTEELAEHDVNLEVSALEGRGNRRLSRLSRVGISHAVHLFERTVQKEKQQIGGYVHTVSLDGRLTLAASTRKRAHKSVIEQVPSALIRAGSFPLGEYMRVAVDAEIKTDALGNRPETKYKFSEILAHSPEASL